MKQTKYFDYDDEFQLESGEILPGFRLSYTTYGRLSADKSNVVWITHALTANADPIEWWPGVVGNGHVIDPDKHFIVCANILGSPYGSTNPLDINPNTGSKYYHDFPALTNRDIARSFDLLRNHLDIEKIASLIGASIGGQQALEWSIMYPDHISSLLLIATNARHSPYGIAFNESQRLAIQADQTWTNRTDDAGAAGLLAARSIALLSYRTASGYRVTQSDTDDKHDNFKASSYQRYQGQKLVDRFNAFSYWTLSKAMDSHNVGRNRGGINQALQQITAKTIVLGITSDILFPTSEQKQIADGIPYAEYIEINSLLGHDGFLTELDKVSNVITTFLAEKVTRSKTEQIC